MENLQAYRTDLDAGELTNFLNGLRNKRVRYVDTGNADSSMIYHTPDGHSFGTIKVPYSVTVEGVVDSWRFDWPGLDAEVLIAGYGFVSIDKCEVIEP